MKRFRIKLVGFGLAALARSAAAADGDWQPLGSPPAPPGSVIQARGEPAVLPTSLRSGVPDRSEFGPATDSLWFPAASRPSIPAEVISVPTITNIVPSPSSTPVAWPRSVPVVGLVGPRVGAVPQQVLLTGAEYPSPLVNVEADPPVIRLPSPATPVQPLPVQHPGDLPPPRSVNPEPAWKGTQPLLMPQPAPPPADFIPPESAQPVLPGTPSGAAAAELPVAPPELMVPLGEPVPGMHGTFGSKPVRLSRDYPSLSDLCDTPRLAAATRGGTNSNPISERGFVDGEFLLWWAKGLNIPVLGTTSTNGGNGFLGQPGTVPILGPGTFIGSFRQGVRLRAGTWFDDCASCGIDGSFFLLGNKTANALFTSDVFPTITRPIFSPNPFPGTGTVIGETGEAVAVPGVLAGSLSAHADSLLYGFDANFRSCLMNTCNSRLTWFAGYRNLNLQESLTITENIDVIGTGGTLVRSSDPVGTMVVVQDRFATENHFNGGQVGGTYERHWGRFSLDARASVALGVTHQELDIDGFQTRTEPGQPPMTFRGGLLAAGPNLGSFTRDKFSVAPEATINLGYWLTPALKFYAGYNFLYWTNVIRPGDQIDRVVDLTFVPNSLPVASSGQLRPQALFRESNMWVTGVQFGLEWRW
jgi:hypothetical protein